MKTIKKILFLLCMCLGLTANAQTVGYTYKPLAAKGCTMKYSVAKQGTEYSIVATVRSDRMIFLSNPIISWIQPTNATIPSVVLNILN